MLEATVNKELTGEQGAVGKQGATGAVGNQGATGTIKVIQGDQAVQVGQQGATGATW